MTTSAKSGRRAAPTSQNKSGTKPRVKKEKAADFVTEYKKYFVPPKTTPDAFHILDLTEGSDIFYSSHT